MKALALSLLSSAALLGACGDNDDPVTPPPPDEEPSIAALAQQTPELATLVAAVQFASDDGDLLTLLDSPGSLTVFAPTNAAFDALAVELTGNAAATGAALLTAENKPLIRTVLTYHVLENRVGAAQIPFGKPITSAEGSVFKIEAGAPPTITDGRNRTAAITATDIAASNGVVHLIDRVILPADKNIVETAQANADFSILVEAVVAADLVGVLSGPGPFTVFAPTNAAFAALLAELGVTKEQLFANEALLSAVLQYHVVPARVFEAEVPIDQDITSAMGASFQIGADLAITDGRGRSSTIVATDVMATNGVIHVIDKVILPPAS